MLSNHFFPNFGQGPFPEIAGKSPGIQKIVSCSKVYFQSIQGVDYFYVKKFNFDQWNKILSGKKKAWPIYKILVLVLNSEFWGGLKFWLKKVFGKGLNSEFWGRLSLESQPQNTELADCIYFIQWRKFLGLNSEFCTESQPQNSELADCIYFILYKELSIRYFKYSGLKLAHRWGEWSSFREKFLLGLIWIKTIYHGWKIFQFLKSTLRNK